MSKVLMFGNQKGGIGKTTVTVMIANGLTALNYNVCVIDTDQQKSVLNARNLDLRAYSITSDKAPFKVFSFTVSELQNNIGAMDKEFDFILIDAAGKMDIDQPIETQEIGRVLMYVDYLFIPFVAGNYNLAATLTYFSFVRRIQTLRQLQARKLNVFGFVNMHRSRSKSNSFLLDDIATLKKSESLEMLKTPLNDYAAFKESDTITTFYAPNSSDSTKVNFTTFLNELIKIIE